MELGDDPCVGHHPRIGGEEAGHVLPERDPAGAEPAGERAPAAPAGPVETVQMEVRSVPPGATALTRTSGVSSWARATTRPRTANLLAV